MNLHKDDTTCIRCVLVKRNVNQLEEMTNREKRKMLTFTNLIKYIERVPEENPKS